MYAIKEEHIILEGDRNIMNGVWNIPIHKKIVQEKTYRKHIQHGLTYNKTCALQCSKGQTRTQSSKVKHLSPNIQMSQQTKQYK